VNVSKARFSAHASSIYKGLPPTSENAAPSFKEKGVVDKSSIFETVDIRRIPTEQL
jgi:hypothetical protein